MIICDGDLLVLLGLQLALVEAERPFKDVFDLTESSTVSNKQKRVKGTTSQT